MGGVRGPYAGEVVEVVFGPVLAKFLRKSVGAASENGVEETDGSFEGLVAIVDVSTGHVWRGGDGISCRVEVGRGGVEVVQLMPELFCLRPHAA